MNQLVSVIIPTFNRGSYLRNTINSVLSQSYKDIEIIVVDDCSTDNTQEILNDLIIDKKINYLKLKVNIGPSQARRIGITISKGAIIAFLDSDDLWYEDKLSTQVPYIINGEFDCVASQIVDCNTTTNHKTIRGSYNPNKNFTHQVLSENCSIPMSTIILKKSIFENFDIFHKPIFFNKSTILYFGDHFELLLKVSLIGNRFHFVNKPLAMYLHHGGNISSYFNSYFAHIYQIFASFKYFKITHKIILLYYSVKYIFKMFLGLLRGNYFKIIK